MSEKKVKAVSWNSVRERVGAVIVHHKAWLARRLVAVAVWIDGPEDTIAFADDPIVDMLHRAIGNRTGKLRVSDAYLICGIEAGRATQDQIDRFGRAIRKLGWERKRRRFGGELEYAYVKGNAKEREVSLLVEYDRHMRSARIEIDTSSTN